VKGKERTVSGLNRERNRRIQITGANLTHGHINIGGHYDFFPQDSLGAPRKKVRRGVPILIELEGMNGVIESDIGTDAKTGKPRRQLRNRTWKTFYAHQNIKAGDWVCLERLSERRYRVRAENGNGQNGTKKTVLEFFAGIGLVRMGLEPDGWRVVYANDVDAQKREMYDAHFGDADKHFQLEDVHKINAADLPDAILATASFPCTDLSLAGGRKGLRGKESSAFFGFLQVLRDMGGRRPPLVLLENVPGFLTSHGGKDFEEAMRGLNELGYAVDPFILDARWFVPQSRARLFIVGSALGDSSDQGWELLSPSRVRPGLVCDFVTSHPNIRWAIRGLPEPPKQAEKKLKDIIDDLPNDAPEWWNKERAEYLYNQMSPRHRAIADLWISKRVWSYGTVFRRVRQQPDGEKRSMGELRSDGFAGCLRTPKGGSGRQILFKAGYGKYAARLLTPNECAKLMGAEGFRIQAPLNQALFGFGDAVCVSVITWIAEHYLRSVVCELERSKSEFVMS